MTRAWYSRPAVRPENAYAKASLPATRSVTWTSAVVSPKFVVPTMRLASAAPCVSVCRWCVNVTVHARVFRSVSRSSMRTFVAKIVSRASSRAFTSAAVAPTVMGPVSWPSKLSVKEPVTGESDAR